MSPANTTFPEHLAERLGELHHATGDQVFAELKAQLEVTESRPWAKGDVEAFRDRLSTRLMEAYRATENSVAFGLLYELNYRVFLNVISSRLRKFYFALDPHDVLQEVFFNIYRYPHKFQADKDQAFRHWASMIIRNTVYKCTREKDREFVHEMQDEEIETHPDQRTRTPLGDAIREESERLCERTYLLYLGMYLAAYQLLSTRERKALHLVEVEGKPYKAAANALGIRLENLKMVIFRARKKILRTLDRVLTTAAAWQPEMVGGSATSRVDRRGARDVLPMQRGRLAGAPRRAGRPGRGAPNAREGAR